MVEITPLGSADLESVFDLLTIIGGGTSKFATSHEELAQFAPPQSSFSFVARSGSAVIGVALSPADGSLRGIAVRRDVSSRRELMLDLAKRWETNARASGIDILSIDDPSLDIRPVRTRP
jgi:hypothetical protein